MESERANRNDFVSSVSVIDVVEPPANPQSFAYSFFLYAMNALNTFLLVAASSLGLQNKSLFKAHAVFFIMAIVSASLSVLSSAILILASFWLPRWIKDKHYTILKTIGSFSAILVPLSLAALVFLPSSGDQDHNWIAYTVLCVISVGYLYLYSRIWKVACAYHEEKHFNSYPVHWSFLLTILVPYSITLVLFFSLRVLWVVVCLSFSVTLLSCIAFMRFSVADKERHLQDKTIDHL